MKNDLNKKKNEGNIIDDFYQHYQATKQDVIKKVVDEWLQNLSNNNFDKLLNERHQKIADLRQSNDNIRVQQEIMRLENINSHIVWGCFLLVGFFWWNKRKENLKKIADLKQNGLNSNVKVEQEERITNDWIGKAFSGKYTSDVINRVWQAYDLTTFNYVNAPLLTDKLTLSNLVSITNMSVVLYHNTPIYDVTFNYLKLNDVTSTKTKVVTIHDFKTNKDHDETLSATHHELTPSIVQEDNLCLLTNYLQPAFSCWNVSYETLFNVHPESENKVLLDLNNPNLNEGLGWYYSGTNSNIQLCFDDSTIANLVNWKTINPQSLNNPFALRKNVFLVKKENHIPFKNYFENILTSLNYNSTQYCKISNLQEVKDKIVNLLINYFDGWFKTAQFPLLINGINNEWYTFNHKYASYTDQKATIPTKIDSWKYQINQYANFFTFFSHNAKLMKWVDIIDRSEVSEGIDKAILSLQSYDSQDQFDNISVNGSDNKPYIIEVPYVHYIKVSEQKTAYIFKLKNWPKNENVRITLTLNNPKPDVGLFSSALSELCSINFNVSDPFLVSHSVFYQDKMKQIYSFVSQFPDFTSKCMIVLSNSGGGMVLVNDPEWFKSHVMEDKLPILINKLI